MSDALLIAKVVVSRDAAAFEELVRRHQSAVRHFLRHLCRGDEAWADDLAQETFIRAWNNLSRFQGDAALSTWLLGIAHNLYRNASRRRRLEAGTPQQGAEEQISGATDLSDLRQDLAQALSALSQDERAVIHLCYLQNLAHSEAASVLDCPIGTVKTHLMRAKEKLRKLLSQWNLT